MLTIFQSRSTRRLAIPAALAVAALVGCGDSGPDLAPVYGRVVYKGKPVANATVLFVKQGAARHSYGETNEQGEFTLTTYRPADGALVGPNQVAVAPRAAVATPAPEVPTGEEYFRMLKESERKPKSTLPARYADIGATDLRVTVSAGENRLTLELQD